MSNKFHEIMAGVERALGYYERFKRGVKVPNDCLGYLLIMHESDAIQRWVDNILPAYTYNKALGTHVYSEEPQVMANLESYAVLLFLKGYSPFTISRLSKYKDAGIDISQIKEWLYGSNRRDGLVGIMTKKVLESGAYCSFCSHLVRRTSKATMPRLTGKVCTCMDRK